MASTSTSRKQSSSTSFPPIIGYPYDFELPQQSTPFTSIHPSCIIETSHKRIAEFVEHNRSGFRSPLCDLIGMQYREITLNQWRAEFRVDQRHLQPFGLMHGGINGIVAEELGSLCAAMHSPYGVVGTHVQAHHVGSGRVGDIVMAEAKPVKIGKQIQIVHISIRAKSVSGNGKERQLAMCQLTAFARPSPTALQASKSSKFTRGMSDDIRRLINADTFNSQIHLDRLQWKKYGEPVSEKAYVAEDCKHMDGQFRFSPFVRITGFAYTYISRTRLDGELTVDARHVQAFGLMQGGMNAVIAEELGSVLAALMMGKQSDGRPSGRVGTFVSCDHLASAFIGDIVRGSATVLKDGSRTQLLQIDIYARSSTNADAKERHIASCQLSTFQAMQPSDFDALLAKEKQTQTQTHSQSISKSKL